MDIHHYIHYKDEHTKHMLEKIFETVINNNQKLHQMAGTLADIQASNVALAAAVAAEDTVIDSAVVLITGFGTTLADIKAQLAAALANGNDPVAVQAVVDAMTATQADIDAKKQTLADAVVANTPAATP